MSELTNDPYLARYIAVSESLSQFVYQMSSAPELFKQPEAAFAQLQNLVSQSAPPSGYSMGLIVPQILLAKLTIARGCLEVHLDNHDEAERCFESALCCADSFDLRPHIIGWISEHIPAGCSFTSLIDKYIESAEHNLSFDTATCSELDLLDSGPEYAMSNGPYEVNDEPVAQAQPQRSVISGASINPVKMSIEIDLIVNAISQSANRDLVLELFDQVNTRLYDGVKFSEHISSDVLGLLDAKLNVLGVLIEVTGPNHTSNREACKEIFQLASERADYWGCLPELLEWKTSQAAIHPSLAEFLA